MSANRTGNSRPFVPAPVRRGGAWLFLLIGLAAGGDIGAQDPVTSDRDRGYLRLGISLGGTGFLGLITEYIRNDWSGELVIGTVGFRDVSVSAAAKHYFGSGRLRPSVGAGLWTLTAWSEEGWGSAVVLRAPLAVDWNVSGQHFATVEVGLNRAILVRRLDPEDDRPPSRNIVPFPGFSYRYGLDR